LFVCFFFRSISVPAGETSFEKRRIGSEFLGKKRILGSEFVGKRTEPLHPSLKEASERDFPQATPPFPSATTNDGDLKSEMEGPGEDTPRTRPERGLGSEFVGKRDESSQWDNPLNSWDTSREVLPYFPEQKRRMGSEFLGKRRMGSEFLGKRGIGSEFLGKRRMGSEFLGKRAMGSEFLGKRRMGSEFLGKRRMGSEFLGKRGMGSEFLGKRRMGSEFLGKRRMGSEFLGKRRMGSEFLGKRSGAPDAEETESRSSTLSDSQSEN